MTIKLALILTGCLIAVMFLEVPIPVVIVLIILGLIARQVTKNATLNESPNQPTQQPTKIDEDKVEVKGYRGETEIIKVLNLAVHGKILRNLYIPTSNGKTTEVDIVFIHSTGIYVIESKNFGGYVVGNENEVAWEQRFFDDKNKMFKFYNPVFQNLGHIKSLANVTGLNRNYFHSLIVFGRRCEIKLLELDVYKDKLIKLEDLKGVFLKQVTENPHVLSYNEVEGLYKTLSKYTNVSDEVKEKHNRNVATKSKQL